MDYKTGCYGVNSLDSTLARGRTIARWVFHLDWQLHLLSPELCSGLLLSFVELSNEAGINSTWHGKIANPTILEFLCTSPCNVYG